MEGNSIGGSRARQEKGELLMTDELQTFLNTWDTEAKKTAAALQALPPGQYDFRPDAGGRPTWTG
jgi:hypothetical protein